jgi:hypothetical protein
MTIRTAESLSLFLDLITDGVSASEASVAVGAAPGSKIAHLWIKESAEAHTDFDTPPDVSEPWCIVRDGTPQWFDIAYSDAVIAGRAARSIRRTSIRSDMEQRLRAKRAEPPKPPSYVAPRVQVGKPSDEPAERFTVDTPAPAPPAARPSYAFKSKPLDASNREPPQEGRFTVVSSRPLSLQQRRAGTTEWTDQGIKKW